MATKKPAKTTHRWEITLIRQRGRFMGSETAIQEPIKQFEITNPEQHRRLIARRKGLNA